MTVFTDPAVYLFIGRDEKVMLFVGVVWTDQSHGGRKYVSRD